MKDGDGVLKNLDVDQIVGLMEALDKSSFDSLQLEMGHFRLTLGKSGAGGPPAAAAATSLPAAPQLSPPAPAAPKEPLPPAKRPAAKQPSPSSTGTVDVRSPIMGLFYSRPDPSSPPFVSIGSEVGEGTTVGLIEVMKVFNAVQAGAKGVIAEVCVQDGETIEIGQTLFRIRPA